MLTQAQIDIFHRNGFLRLEQVYSPAEIRAMSDELDEVMRTFANWNAAWRGPWRKEYLDETDAQRAVLVAIHELHHYSAAWTRALTKPELAEAIVALLNSEAVEIHHSTLHAKAPGQGAPFPLYEHRLGRAAGQGLDAQGPGPRVQIQDGRGGRRSEDVEDRLSDLLRCRSSRRAVGGAEHPAAMAATDDAHMPRNVRLLFVNAAVLRYDYRAALWSETLPPG